MIKNKKKYYVKDLDEKIVLLPFLLYAFWGLGPYFTWKNFLGGVFGYIGTIPIMSIFGALAIAVGVFYLLIKKIILKRNIVLLLIALCLAVSIICLGGGIDHILSFEWMIFFVPMIFILLPLDMKAKCFNAYSWIIAVTLIIPIVVYFFVHIGVNIPHIEIVADERIKSSSGYTYLIYPFASQLDRYGISYYSFRLCGIYNEAGLLGTIAALLLVQQNYRIKNDWKNIVLFVGGILSFSLAFYALTILYFLIKNAVKLNKKNIIIIIGIITAYFIFININFSNANLANFQSRIMLTSTGLSGDTRSNAMYDIEFSKYLQSNLFRLLFGFGHGSLEAILKAGNIDGCSYKTLLYDYGVVGFILQIVWILYFCSTEIRKDKFYDKSCVLSFVIVYIANMYQRPSMFAFCYLLIIVGGMCSKKYEHITQNNLKRGIK